jgi:hypothetical protein
VDKNSEDILDALDFIKVRMATKGDLKQFATKDEVRIIVREELRDAHGVGRSAIEADANLQRAVRVGMCHVQTRAPRQITCTGVASLGSGMPGEAFNL